MPSFERYPAHRNAERAGCAFRGCCCCVATGRQEHAADDARMQCRTDRRSKRCLLHNNRPWAHQQRLGGVREQPEAGLLQRNDLHHKIRRHAQRLCGPTGKDCVRREHLQSILTIQPAVSLCSRLMAARSSVSRGLAKLSCMLCKLLRAGHQAVRSKQAAAEVKSPAQLVASPSIRHQGARKVQVFLMRQGAVSRHKCGRCSNPVPWLSHVIPTLRSCRHHT